MEMGKIIKNAGIALMIIGLIFMVVVYIKSENINYVMGGLLIVGIGSLLNAYGNKQIPKT